MFIGHSVLVLFNEPFSFILDFMSIMHDCESAVGKAWLLEIVLVIGSGKVGKELVAESLIWSRWQSWFLINKEAMNEIVNLAITNALCFTSSNNDRIPIRASIISIQPWLSLKSMNCQSIFSLTYSCNKEQAINIRRQWTLWRDTHILFKLEHMLIKLEVYMLVNTMTSWLHVDLPAAEVSHWHNWYRIVQRSSSWNAQSHKYPRHQ